MPHPLIPATLLALALPALVAVDTGVDAPPVEGAQITTMTFHERIIVRVPRLGPPPAQTMWKEKRGPKCIEANELAGALFSAPAAVDLVLKGNHRVRAVLEDECEALNFYSGFYLKPSADGKVCAGRDAIRARSGVSCAIEGFRALKLVNTKR